MSNIQKQLESAYDKTTYQMIGHSRRKIQILKESLIDIDGSTDSDLYGKGKLIEDFQNKIATFLGKKTAVFFPSGTMAQQIALRIWCDQKGQKKVAYHPLCHLEIHEEDGLKVLHQIETTLLADKDRLIQLEDILNLNEDIACLLLELPQREIGGQLPDYKELEAISVFCREKGIKLHMDGARLFEILPFYKKSAEEICQLFDSVYVSFYKGIGGIAGAILAGDEDFCKEAIVWKRRYGGDLISLYPYIISADFYFHQRHEKMEKYYQEAKEFAGFFNRCQCVSTRPVVPVSNMFHVHFRLPKVEVESILISIYEQTGIGLTSYVKEVDDSSCYFEVNVGDRYETIPKEKMIEFFNLLDEKMNTRA